MEFIDLKSQYGALKRQMDARIQAVLDHGQFIMGPEVRELEARLAELTGARNCITVSSGTEALLIALMAKGIGPGDEVITSPFSFIATAEVIVLAGARPVFVDIEPDTCNIDASKIEARISSRTRAIIPVSLYGQCADMEEINAIARNRGISVVEDAAQSFGARYQGKASCNLSEFGCTSFFPSKPLGCYGDGGAIFTSDDGLAEACREIRVHGQRVRYEHSRIGVGGRMDTLQCAIVLGKLERFGWEIARREELGAAYAEAIDAAGIPVRPVTVRPDRNSVWGQYTVFADDRERVQKVLRAEGIPTAVHYPRPIHRQPAYQGLDSEARCPQSELASGRVLSLPMSADLGLEGVERVVASLRKAFS